MMTIKILKTIIFFKKVVMTKNSVKKIFSPTIMISEIM